MTHSPLSASDLHALVVNKHYWCDEFTKVGTAIGVVLVGRTYEVQIRWWWGCQTPVAVPFEELELLDSFACPVKFTGGKLQEKLEGSKKRENKKRKKLRKKPHKPNTKLPELLFIVEDAVISKKLEIVSLIKKGDKRKRAKNVTGGAS